MDWAELIAMNPTLHCNTAVWQAFHGFPSRSCANHEQGTKVPDKFPPASTEYFRVAIALPAGRSFLPQAAHKGIYKRTHAVLYVHTDKFRAISSWPAGHLSVDSAEDWHTWVPEACCRAAHHPMSRFPS